MWPHQARVTDNGAGGDIGQGHHVRKLLCRSSQSGLHCEFQPGGNAVRLTGEPCCSVQGQREPRQGGVGGEAEALQSAMQPSECAEASLMTRGI